MKKSNPFASLLQLFGAIPFFCLAAFTASCSVTMAFAIYKNLSQLVMIDSGFAYYLWNGISLVIAYIGYGLTLIFVAPLLNVLLRGRLKPWRGKAVSLGCLPWYVHATLTLLVRLTFLEFVTPSPISLLYYRLMGMKIGKNVTINSTAIADPSLIELGDGVTIGGSASIMAHYAQGGFLVISPVKIGDKATIGLRAIIMGGVTIGAKAKILAGSFVLPGTNIPDRETWGGIPAMKVKLTRTRVKNP